MILPSQLPAEPYDEFVRTEWKLLALKRVENPFVSIPDIAKSIGYNPNTVRIWMRTPAYQRYENWYISQMRDRLVGGEIPELPGSRFKTSTVPERFQEYAAEMQERLLDLIETASSEKLQADLIEKWLAYGGTVPKGLPSGPTGGPTLTADKMIVFVTRAKEIGLDVPSLTALLPAPAEVSK